MWEVEPACEPEPEVEAISLLLHIGRSREKRNTQPPLPHFTCLGNSSQFDLGAITSIQGSRSLSVIFLHSDVFEMPEYICYCSKCYCKTFKTLRTVREHLSTDKQALDLAVQSGSLQGRNHPLQKHIDDTERSIAKAIEAERRASQVHAGVSTIAGDHGTRSQSLSAHGMISIASPRQADLNGFF